MLRRLIGAMLTPRGLGAGFAAGAVGAVAVSAWTDVLDAWMPNVATELASLALTVVIVEAVVRRQAARRLAPRVDRAITHIGVEFARFIASVALDYAATHADTYRPIPRDAMALLDQWLEDQDAADMPRVPLPGDDKPLLAEGYEFAEQIDQYDHRDRDVLEPDLIAAIRDVWGARNQARWWQARVGNMLAPRELVDPERLAHRVFVSAVRSFAKVFRPYAATPAVFELDDALISFAEEFREMRLRERQAETEPAH